MAERLKGHGTDWTDARDVPVMGGTFDLDGVMTLSYKNIEALTDSIIYKLYRDKAAV